MIDQGQHHRFADKEFVNTAEKSNNAIDIINRVEKKRKWLKGSIDRIAEIQLEPSFPCNLRCPGCLQGIHENPLSTEPAPYMFPYEWFERMIDSIVMNQVRLNRLVFVGRGEPTLNAKLPDMVSYARTTIPGLTMSMDTNANQPFKNEYLNLNWINCSIDGPDQASYSKYRRNGRFDKTIEFMRSGVRSKNESKSTCKIKWKYILFNTNDTDEHLRLAQELASDIGIDELHFIITHCGSFDNKITPSARFKSINDLRAYIENNVIFDKVICSTAT